MKENPNDQFIKRDMRAGRLTRDGFLGCDERSIEEIILADEAALADTGVSAARLADTMRTLTQKGLEGMGEDYPVDGFVVKVEEYMGFMGCPFKDGHRMAKRNTTVRKESGEKMAWTDLSIHLIGAHSFFQGKGADYRLEPADLVQFLGLK